MEYQTLAAAAKADSFQLASSSGEVRNAALQAVADALPGNREAIFAANQKDLKKAAADRLPQPIVSRLKFDQGKLDACISGIRDLIALPDPLSRELLRRELDTGLTLVKTTCPIGVIGVIFESRPDALIQISSLCVKSGNCAILKGGSEAANTNKALFDCILAAGTGAGLPAGFITLIESRAGIDALLQCDESVDLLIPRGSNEFVRYIMDHSTIPVMGHADGICHIYADVSADMEKAIPVIIDSKTQYAAACNAAETLLVHEEIADRLLPRLAEASGNSIAYRGDKRTCCILGQGCRPATRQDFETEYLDTILSVKLVTGLDEAIAHINRYGSHHTDCILTEDAEAAARFMSRVDSAGVYQNCSTRFADGFRYGFGAEVGISTGKLHARGPVGLDGLVTYKYELFGSGQIVDDYAKGIRRFNFKDLRT